MNSDDVRQLIDRYFDAERSFDIDKCMTFFADDAVWEDVGIEHSFSGKDAIRQSWEDFFSAVSDCEMERTAFVVDENGYAFSWILRAKVIKPFGDFPISDHRIEIKGSSIGTVQDGKITWNCDYWNMASVARQLAG